jgi:predicted O-methyltransferase YrrM
MDVTTLLANPPPLHRTGSQLSSRWKLADAELRFLDRMLQSGMKTIETGAGLSTILFSLKGADHTAIVPDEGLRDRILAWCAEHGIDTSRTTFVLERSETALPKLADQASGHDLALIDGSHSFPMPFIDWFYISGMLKVGGLVMIDDLHIWTCETLTRFLEHDERWEGVQETPSAAIYRKISAEKLAEWKAQPFVARRSRATSLAGKLSYANDLIGRRKLGLLWSSLARTVSAASGRETSRR